ncbi:MAG: extracellular solute-binding protein, partial [Spirochaetia bacterium]|nr:extracellular solute-binding protein [Spirochaetia bacterium]
MRNLFLAVLLILLGFTQFIVFRASKVAKPVEGVPVIHWVTDPNPVRPAQVALFYKWLERNRYPKIRVEFDYANQGIQKTVVQGVTGVAGDLIDVMNSYVPYLKEIGILQDVSDVTRELGLPDVYNPKIHSELFVDGKRYGFPRSLTMGAFFVNRDLFKKLGMEPPPYRWDFATFEKIGIEFNRRANPAGK